MTSLTQRAARCAPFFGCILSALAGAQTTQQLHVASDHPVSLHDSFVDDGYDVLPGSLDDHGFELFASPQEVLDLAALGIQTSVLAKGRPLRAILAERETGDGVPSGYPNLTQVYARMAQAATDHPAICQLVDLTALYGTPPTEGGRHLMAVRISDSVALDEDEPAVLIAACHHAREVVTPVIALEAIDRLTDDYGSVPSITAAVDQHEIWIAPVWNPDGYEYVFNGDNFWRKNRHVLPGGTGVDLNRNYPQGWTNGCSGSTSASSSTYKGPSAGSEAETLTMITWAQDRRFAKVLDFHSSGREALWGYDCWNSPLDSFYQAEATSLSTASGYQGDERRPSADGEHQQWHFARQGALAYLVETQLEFQPSHASALAEAALAFGGIEWLLARNMPLTGHVTDACSGLPLAATITVQNLNLPQGETNSSGGAFGRWHAYLPAGNYNIQISAPGYATQVLPVAATASTTTQLDVALQPANSGGVGYCIAGFNSVGLGASIFHVGSTSIADNNFALMGVAMPAGQFGLFLYGQNETQTPLFDGYLCVNNPFIRLGAMQTSPQGTLTQPIDFNNPPVPSGQITAGSTWSFQIAYRDLGFGMTGSNLSHGWRVTFCP